jgi:hypothetical protein
MAYCNSGPPVAAYIVEKLTGQRFEDYVTQNFFLRIGMKTATYFEQPSPQLTTLYQDDGKTPYHYWNILERPAGAINASANDMAAYVGFYLNRGAVHGQQIMPATDIDRVETPTRTWQAQQALKAGYGLSNYTSIHDGFVYHGHNGGVEGGLTDMSYLPEYGVGYFYSINSGNGGAFEKIGDAIRAYITRGLTKPAVPAAAPLPADAPQYAGWYEPDSPRSEFMHGIERLGLHRVHFAGGNLVLTNLIGTINDSFVPVSGNQFRYLSKKDPPEPIATGALIAPNAEGQFVFLGGTWKRVPALLALAEVAAMAWFVLAFAAIVLYAPFWLIGGLFKKRRRPAERAIRLWPLIAVLSLAASAFYPPATCSTASATSPSGPSASSFAHCSLPRLPSRAPSLCGSRESNQSAKASAGSPWLSLPRCLSSPHTLLIGDSSASAFGLEALRRTAFRDCRRQLPPCSLTIHCGGILSSLPILGILMVTVSMFAAPPGSAAATFLIISAILSKTSRRSSTCR